MINFLLHINLSQDSSEYSSWEKYFREKPSLVNLSNDQFELLLWGDPIIPVHWQAKLPDSISVETIIDNVSGHYYYLLMKKGNCHIFVGNSFFSILPVYYRISNGKADISDTPDSISAQTDSRLIDKQFILENILFYYPLFNRSLYHGVALLPANHYIEIFEGKCQIKSHRTVAGFFTEHPVKWKNAVDRVAGTFLETVGKYFPDEFYYNALTGGFDGRTLVAAGLGMAKKFAAYSFGSSLSSDIVVAEKLSALAGISYQKIDLDQQYANEHSLNNGLEFIKRSSGSGSFARSHYLFAIKQLAATSRYVITGNFGSEVFRAAHMAGAVISPNLYKMFAAKDYDEAIRLLDQAAEWKWLYKPAFGNAWESLIEDLRQLPLYNPAYSSLTLNQKFYITVFDEIFRKYFGAEMVNQFQYMINRTPFLDLRFFSELLKTGLSGVYSDFFTHNPFKRFKGQITYAHIIGKSYPGFLNVSTDKGYCPADLLSFTGKLKIARSFFTKRYFSAKTGQEDPYGVIMAFRSNVDFWKSIPINDQLFDRACLKTSLNGVVENRNSFFVALSQAWYVNHLTENYGLEF